MILSNTNMTSIFRRFISVSAVRYTPPIFKINASIQLDMSDPLVVKFSIELRDKWKAHSDEESRADVCYHPTSTPVISLPPSPPKNNQSDYDMESALSHIMK